MASAGKVTVELEVDLKSFKAQISEAGSNVKEFGQDTVATGVLIADAVKELGKRTLDFAIDSIKSYGLQEQAIVSLNQALANHGRYSEAASTDLQNFASALQETTTYADENIIAVESSLVTFGLEGEKLKQVTRATLDLATAKGIDLTSAANLLGKAFVGETATLSRYGIIIDENIPKSEKFAAALDKVEQMFGGQAEQQRLTTLGQFKALENQFDDLKESIGGMIAGPATQLVSWLAAILRQIQNAINVIISFKQQAGSMANFISQTFVLALTAILQTVVEVERWVTQAILKYLNLIPGLGNALKLVGIDINAVGATLNTAFQATDTWIADQGIKLQGLANIWLKNGDDAAATEEKKAQATNEYTNKAVAAANQRLVSETEIQTAILLGHQKNLEEREKAEAKFKEQFELTTNHWRDFTIRSLYQITDQMGQGVADMILEAKKFSQVIQEIWKNLARMVIAEITRMIAKWLVWKALTAAGTGGFGGFMADGGIISEPSVITGLRSGVSHIAGEAGPEAVVPLSQVHSASAANQTMQDYAASQSGNGDAGGNINLTVNISGQFLEGDESVWQRMFRDKILPEIRRATMSNPTGNFIRRRGAVA